ncbi:MAG: hypothetical protein KGH79_01660 [Patescibacteria group bacterium]|nr:hypothetical protein [Patescibacteria group bacterium]
MRDSRVSEEIIAKAQEFETKACPQCHQMTLWRESSILTCKTCRHVIVEISRSQYLRFIQNYWPNKLRVLNHLADHAYNITTNPKLEGPVIPLSALFRALPLFGQKVEQASKSGDCIDAFFYLLQHLACPEPGWEGIEIRSIA